MAAFFFECKSSKLVSGTPPFMESQRMAKNVPATVEFSDAIVRQIAMDVGKQVVAHIEYAYPDACRAVAWKSARLSIRNCTHNSIMEAVKAANIGEIEPMLDRHSEHRRNMRKFQKMAGGSF
jgi:hypothetical protein